MPELGLKSFGSDGGVMDRDFGQGSGPLSDVNPGERVRNVTQNAGPDLGQSGNMVNVPDSPGPAALGRTPLLGMARRERGLPVVRDQIPSLMD